MSPSISDRFHTVTRLLSLIPGGNLPDLTPAQKYERETPRRSVMAGTRISVSLAGWVAFAVIGVVFHRWVARKTKTPEIHLFQ